MDATARNGIDVPQWKRCSTTSNDRAADINITSIGIDLAKNVFQVHAVNVLQRVGFTRESV
jgi:transposase